MESRKAQKQRSIARFNWFAMKMYLKNKVVQKERQELTEKILSKLDILANPASKKIMEKTAFNPSVRILKQMTLENLFPLKNFRKQRNKCQTLEQVGNHSAFRVLSSMADFMPAVQEIAMNVTPSPAPLQQLRIVRYKKSKLDSKVERAAKSAAERCFCEMEAPNLFLQVDALISLSADKRCHTRRNDKGFILDQIALTAVGHQNVFYGLNRLNSAKRMIRPLLRMAYPSKDPSLPFSPTREVTMSGSDGEDDEMIISRDAFAPRDSYGHKLYEFDLSLLEGTIRRENHIIEMRIGSFGVQSQDQKEASHDVKERKIKEETIEESCCFVDDFIKEGLIDFACDIVGLNDAIDDAVKIQSYNAKHSLALAVSLNTFNNVNALAPFLWGAANAKMHKLKGRSQNKKDDKLNTVA
jgi:hypothetical protein